MKKLHLFEMQESSDDIYWLKSTMQKFDDEIIQ